MFVLHSIMFVFQGVVTAAISLITCLSQKNPDEFKTCVSLAVSRLSRVCLFSAVCLRVRAHFCISTAVCYIKHLSPSFRSCPRHPPTCRTTHITLSPLPGSPVSCCVSCSATLLLRMALLKAVWSSVWRPFSTKHRNRPNLKRCSTPTPRTPSCLRLSLSLFTMTGEYLCS